VLSRLLLGSGCRRTTRAAGNSPAQPHTLRERHPWRAWWLMCSDSPLRVVGKVSLPLPVGRLPPRKGCHYTSGAPHQRRDGEGVITLSPPRARSLSTDRDVSRSAGVLRREWGNPDTGVVGAPGEGSMGRDMREHASVMRCYGLQRTSHLLYTSRPSPLLQRGHGREQSLKTREQRVPLPSKRGPRKRRLMEIVSGQQPVQQGTQAIDVCGG
jgi:hypothetical protein